MDSQTKRTLAATAMCLLLLFAWTQFQRVVNPPKPQTSAPIATSTDANPTTALPTTANATDAVATSMPSSDGKTVAAAPVSGELRAVGATGENAGQSVIIGNDVENPRGSTENPYKLAATISPIGASVSSLHLADYRAHVAKDRKHPKPDPYELLRTVDDPKNGYAYRSFVSERLYLVDMKKDVSLADVPWQVSRSSDDHGESAALSVTIKLGELDVARIVKTYRIEKTSPTIKISYQLENLGAKPQMMRLTETGPTGFEREDHRYDHVRALTAVIGSDGRVRVNEKPMRSEIFKAADHKRDLTPDEDHHYYWSAISNKYFTCIVAPQPMAGSKSNYPKYVQLLSARTRLDDPEIETDLTTVHAYSPADPVPAGGTAAFQVDAYCGPKSERAFEAIPEAASRHYLLTMSVDRSMCTFDFVSTMMHWLLDFIHGIVGNYGVAIIFLVIVVRSLLHPITKKGQINMMKMQKGMARLKPKLDALQEQYKNDKQKLAAEQFKLQREEGFNPASQMMGCLPMFLQMPIWVALYTTLNTNVDLRHAPFFGYIRDLSAPDTLIAFTTPIHIPLISTMMGGPITALNLLPIIMTALMYGQQKLTQKLTKPEKPPEPKLDKDGNPLPDTTAQQQKIMSFMMIFMGFIFYNMPSGLCLYILCSSFLGMCEQWYIRKHIKDQESRGEFDAVKPTTEPKAPKKAGWLQRKVEELQKVAEEQRVPQPKSPIPTRGKTKKKSRF